MAKKSPRIVQIRGRAFESGRIKLTAMLPTLRTVIHAIVIEVMLPIMLLVINVPTLHVFGLLQPLAHNVVRQW